MRLSRFLVPLLAFSWIEACSVYHDGLLGDSDDDADSSGGKSSGGKPSSSSGGKGADDDGGSGGRASGGASTGSGGGGATNTGGMPDMGGSNSGGATPDSGGAPSAGGMPAAGGDTGTGGGPLEGPFVLTDMSTHIISSNPFFGEIYRYNQEGTTWAAKTVAEMLEPRDASDEDDLALHVAATFDDDDPNKDDDWGIDIALTLKRGDPFDLSPYKKIIFEVKGAIRGTPLRVALEDYASHRDTDLCSKIGEGDDCDKHVEALSLIPVSSSWKVQEVDFSLFEGCGEGCTRKNPFDITRVYAIHFKMDPPDGEAVDFYLDNIYIDE